MQNKPHVDVVECKSIGEAVDYVASLHIRSLPETLWFRGMTNNEYDLRPSIYRGQSNYNESKMFATFIDFGVHYPEVKGLEGWDCYIAGQHYGIPTRLLDWTESLTHAIFFAFDGWSEDSTPVNKPCIWVMNPSRFNLTVGESTQLPGIKDKHLGEWEACVFDPTSSLPEHPIAFRPRRSNKRIVAQHGMFTVHGSSDNCLTRFVVQNSTNIVPSDVMTRIDFVGFSNSRVVSCLKVLGMTRSAVYPDVVNFARSIKESRKF